MARTKHQTAYQSRPCWWCGSRLATSGGKKVVDQIGNEHQVHGVCHEFALESVRLITAQPNEWPLIGV